jgi:predicted patatin/cPLA2 family phospholipase
MAHSLGVDSHYITRDVEVHRREYLKGYPYLRIFEPPETLTKTYVTLTQLQEQLRKRDETIFELKTTIQRLENMLNVLMNRPSLQIEKEALSTTEKLTRKLPKKYQAEA